MRSDIASGASRYECGLCVGFDSADKVSEEYEAPGTFTGGKILGMGVDVGKDTYLDLEQLAAAAMARD